MRSLLLCLAVICAGSIVGCRRSDARYELCTPGDRLLIGCTINVGERCTGDPTLAVCEDSIAPEACERTSPSPPLLAGVDDVDGLCPEVTVTCPASGRIGINPDPYGSRSYVCRFAVVSLSP
jgi:hypothetical protein